MNTLFDLKMKDCIVKTFIPGKIISFKSRPMAIQDIPDFCGRWELSTNILYLAILIRPELY